jgi:hypothetical protein
VIVLLFVITIYRERMEMVGSVSSKRYTVIIIIRIKRITITIRIRIITRLIIKTLTII